MEALDLLELLKEFEEIYGALQVDKKRKENFLEEREFFKRDFFSEKILFFSEIFLFLSVSL